MSESVTVLGKVGGAAASEGEVRSNVALWQLRGRRMLCILDALVNVLKDKERQDRTGPT